MSESSLLSIAVFRIAVGKATKLTNWRAARPHQQQVRNCSQNSRDRSLSRYTGRNGEPIRLTIRTVSRAKKSDMQMKCATRRRLGINLTTTRSATTVRQKTRDRSIAFDVRRLTFGVQCSNFSVWRSPGGSQDIGHP